MQKMGNAKGTLQERAKLVLTKNDYEQLSQIGLDQKQFTSIIQAKQSEFDKKSGNFTTTWRKPQKCKELRLILLGKTGAGKSATGNLILGKDVFETSYKSTSVTQTIKRGEAVVDDIKVQVIDTPGFYDTNRPKEEIVSEIAKAFETFSDGIDGFLFVYNTETYRFTHDERNVFAMLEETADLNDLLKCSYMVMTHGDGMQISLNDFIEEEYKEKSPMGEIMCDSLKKRVIVVENNSTSEYFRQLQREQLIRLIAESHSGGYVNKAMHKDQQKTRAEIAHCTEEQIRAIERAFDDLLSGRGYGTMKGLSKEDEEEMIMYAAKQATDKENEANEALKRKLNDAAEKVLKGKIHRLTDKSFFEKLKNVMVPLLEIVCVVIKVAILFA